MYNILDPVKRKAIPLWIREALEKREKQKQREFAKQQEEESNVSEIQESKSENVKDNGDDIESGAKQKSVKKVKGN